MRSSFKWGQTTWFLFVQPHGKVGPSSIRQNLCRIHTFHRLDVHHCSLIMILLSILSFPAFRRALKTACFINSWGFPLSVLNSCCQLNMSSIFILIHHIHVDHQMTHHFFPLLFFQYVKDIWSMARNVSASALVVDDSHSDLCWKFHMCPQIQVQGTWKTYFLGFHLYVHQKNSLTNTKTPKMGLNFFFFYQKCLWLIKYWEQNKLL